MLPEASDAAGDDHLLYLAFHEPVFTNRLDPVREAQHFWIASEPDAFWRPRVWQRLGTDARIPEAKKAEFLNIPVQPEVF